MVSVIVPVYNVEKYLRQCLDSLKAQTLADVEFIVIDDGSTDCSGAICDEYGREDKRFRVFHTENRGLSAARNRGLDEARGEWIEFVDSDDWVEPGFCEIPYRAAIENNADLVIFQRALTNEKGRIKREKKRETPLGIITQEQAIDYGYVVTWNKLYNRQLFSAVYFPEGHVYEDIATTYKLIYKASSIMILQEVLIYHRRRKESISHTRKALTEQDRFSNQIQKYNELIQYGYPVDKAINTLRKGAIVYCAFMEPSTDALYVYAERVLSEIKKNPKKWQWKLKLPLILWKMNKDLFNHTCELLNLKAK